VASCHLAAEPAISAQSTPLDQHLRWMMADYEGASINSGQRSERTHKSNRKARVQKRMLESAARFPVHFPAFPAVSVFVRSVF